MKWDERWTELYKTVLDENVQSLGEAITLQPGNTYTWEARAEDAVLQLITECRSLLRDTVCEELKWINPAAVIVPLPPEDLLGNISGTWDETLQFASWLPILFSDDQTAQKIFINTYLEANFAQGTDINQHMSTHLINWMQGGHFGRCFRGTQDDNNLVTLVCCRNHCRDDGHCYGDCGANGRHAELIGDHYKELFGLYRGSAIFFLPHSGLSRVATHNSMYQSYLVGSYLCVSADIVKCACQLPPAIVDASDRLSMLMYLKARRKANMKLRRELEVQARKLDKYRQMFDLLTPPLRNLTEALVAVQADSQELRAILYEPMDAIFACQPLIAELFDESKTLPGVGRPEHTVSRYQRTSDGMLKAELVLAHALARFKGEIGKSAVPCRYPGADEELDLKGQVGFWSVAHSDKKHAFSELSQCILAVFGLQSWSNFECDDDNSIINYLIRLKERFFTAYKPGEANKALKWSVLKSFIRPDINLLNTCKSGDATIDTDKSIILAANTNPLSVHGHFIEFVASVINYNCKEDGSTLHAEVSLEGCNVINSQISVTSATEVTCKFKNKCGKPFVDSAGLEKLYGIIGKEIKCRKSRVQNIGEHGDFHLPFVKLIRRFPEDSLSKIRDLLLPNDSIKIIVANEFEISLGNEFIITTKRPSQEHK